MSWTIEYNSDLKIIVVTSGGVWTPELDMAMLADLKQGADRYRCNSFLVDHRKCRMNFTFMTTFKRPDVYSGLGFSRDTKAALVWNRIIKDFLFFENVCVNRGFNVRVFDNYEAALAWLVPDGRQPD